MRVPSLKAPSYVSPRSGLKGFCYFITQYKDPNAKVMHNLNLSSGSLIIPAYLRKIGPNPKKSQIFSSKLLGSNILIGKDNPITLYPEKTFDAA
jgi:hypothetical protein